MYPIQLKRAVLLHRMLQQLCCLVFAAGAACPVVAQTSALGQTQGAQQITDQPCAQPAPLFSASDYTGPFNKTVSYFSRKLEIKTVHAPHAGKGHKLCSLNAPEKFHLFLKNTVEPVTLMASAFNAGLAQAENNDPSFGQGMAGYGKRFGAALLDNASQDFFHTFAFPVIFRQDPRYYRKGGGSTNSRLSHALTHVFVARSDSGKRMFNFSEWLGTTASTALANTYHPGNRRGFGPAAERIGINIGTDAGFDVLREFWPEIAHALHLPFRVRGYQEHSAVSTQHSAPKHRR